MKQWSLNNLPVRAKVLSAVMLVLLLLAIGTEGFLLRYLKASHERNLANFATNLVRSVALSVSDNLAIGDTYALDRFFLNLGERGLQGVTIKQCTVYGNDGRVVGDLRPEHFGRSPDAAWIRSVLKRPARSPPRFYDEGGHSMVAVATPVYSHTNRVGTVFLILYVDSFRREYRALVLLSLVLTGGFILLLGVFLLVILRGIILKPLQHLSHQARRISDGDFEHHIQATSTDEFGDLARAMESMRTGILADQESLRTAYDGVMRSEKKYRVIAEGSPDLIFTLDEELRFLSANKRLFELLPVRKKDLNQTFFRSLMFEHPDWTDRFVHGQLDEFLKSGDALTSRILMQSRFPGEPISFALYLEFLDIDERREILGRLSARSEDRLLPFFESEKKRIVFDNHFSTADEVSEHLGRFLPRYLKPDDALEVQMCVREMIINAIEHGNLGVSFDEKTQMQERGRYLEFIQERQQAAPYRDRKVTVEYVLSAKVFSCRISDEGEGFDHRAMRARRAAAAREGESELLMHGRGILLTETAFDRVEYNEKGNQLTLTKHLPLQ